MAAVTRALTGSESPLSGALPALPPAPAAREEREREAAAAVSDLTWSRDTRGCWDQSVRGGNQRHSTGIMRAFTKRKSRRGE